MDRLIINADDFGLSPAVNHDIAACIAAGRVSSTTLMANMPAFEEAVDTAHAGGFSDRIGIHVNLTQGVPVSGAMQDWCGAGGEMALPRSPVRIAGALSRAVEEEIRAQIQRVIAAGIVPTHLDSHHHVFNAYPYLRRAVSVAATFGIRSMRMTRNALYDRSVAKVTFKWLHWSYQRARGIRTVRWFTDVTPYYHHIRGGGRRFSGDTELMCHPGAASERPADGLSETELLLSDAFGRFLEPYTLVSYQSV